MKIHPPSQVEEGPSSESHPLSVLCASVINIDLVKYMIFLIPQH
jgi:hypothetical protein